MRLSKVYIWHLSPETGQKAINIKDSGKKIDTMANVSIFCGNFFNWLEIEKYAFSFDIHPLLDQSTCGNYYHGNICMVIITTGTLV